MNLTLTILCDNSVKAAPGLIGEHGFACHIATEQNKYLVDTGNGLGLINNALSCGIDLLDIDAVFLSHGHWDHCGGLLQLLELRAGLPTPIYAHPAIFDEKISRRAGQERKIGTGFTRQQAEKAGAEFLLSSSPIELPGGLIFSGEIPRLATDGTDDELFYRQGNDLCADPLRDDQSLFLQGEHGISVLCGCAHAGVQNILAQAQRLTGATKLYGLIGGLHLMFSNTEQEEQIIKTLAMLEIQLLAVSHCTGFQATSRLSNAFRSGVSPAVVGTKIRL